MSSVNDKSLSVADGKLAFQQMISMTTEQIVLADEDK